MKILPSNWLSLSRLVPEIRSLCYELIKGKYTPLSFKFVFQLKPEHVQSILGKEHLSPESTKLKSMVLTVKYDGSKALLTSGTSYQTFAGIWPRI